MLRETFFRDFRLSSHHACQSREWLTPRRRNNLPYVVRTFPRLSSTSRASGKTTSTTPLSGIPSISTRKRMLRNGVDASRAMLVHPLDAFIGQFQQLNEHFVAFAIKVAGIVLDGPCIPHDEPRLVCAGFILYDDSDILSAGEQLSIGDLPMPLKQVERRCDSPLQYDVAEFSEAGKLTHVGRVRAFPVVDHVRCDRANLHFTEPCYRKAINLQAKTEIAQWILAWHGVTSVCIATLQRSCLLYTSDAADE